MGETLDRIDILVAKLRKLPAAQQAAAVEALSEFTNEPYQLSDDELAILLPALADIHDGQNSTDAGTDDVLNGPWS